MRRIPETYRNADWPRKVAQMVNKLRLDLNGAQEAAPSRAVLWFHS